jgi:DNA-binding response OmpR family regulator
MDLMMPGMDGSQITQDVRAEGVKTPIIVLTGRGETEHKVDLLNKGADDYLVKPFSFEELLARINSVLRRPELSKPTILRVGPLEMDMSTRVVRKRGEEIALTLKEFALLECFMRQPNEVLSREKLFDHVWDFNSLSWSNVLDVHMKNLRKKLGSDEEDPLFETVRGVGYRLVGEVG